LVRGPERRSLGRRLFSTEGVLPTVRRRNAHNLLPWGLKPDVVLFNQMNFVDEVARAADRDDEVERLRRKELASRNREAKPKRLLELVSHELESSKYAA
jgi:hypothetical protein